jgi:hypothetical protein
MAAYRSGPRCEVLRHDSSLQLLSAVHGALPHLSAPNRNFGRVPYCERSWSTGTLRRLSGTISMTIVSILKLK